MNGHDPISADEAASVDAVTARYFRTEPAQDRSGVLAPVPAPPAPKQGESAEDAEFAHYMERVFGVAPSS